MLLFSAQFSSVAQLWPTLCDPMDCSTPGFPVHHQLRELTQTHVHRVRDAIQPSHPLWSPSPPAFNLSQHQGLFQRVSSSLILLAFALRIPYRKQFRMSWWIQQIIKSHRSCEKSHFTLFKIVCFHREQVIFRPLKVHASICQSEDDNSVMGIFQTTVGLTKCRSKQQPEWAFQNRPPLTLK